MSRDALVRSIHAHPDLSNAEKRLALYLLDRQDDGGAIRVHTSEISADTAILPPHVSRAINALVKAGVLSKRPLRPFRKGEPRREYRFVASDREAVSA